MIWRLLLSVFGVLCGVGTGFGHPNHQLDLTYMTPGKTWESDGLPIGNAHFGALVLGGIAEDRLRLTDPLLDGEAGRVQPLADLVIATGHEPEQARTFLRRLDLQTAKVEVSYRDGRLRHRREYFASYPDKVLVGRMRAIRKGSLNLALSWDSPHKDAVVTYDAASQRFGISGQGFAAQLEIRFEGGALTYEQSKLRLQAANAATLMLTLSSSGPLDRLKGQEHREIYQKHIADYQDQFHAMYITLEGGAKSHLETSKRRQLYAEAPEEDPGFEELLFQYGRYLALSSARPGSVASPHGRGIWCYPDRESPVLERGDSPESQVSSLLKEATQGRPDQAYGHFRKLLQTHLRDNLLTTDQQFAASMGLVKGVRKFFAEEKEGVLYLANNLPKAWTDGSVVGMRTPNYELAYVWQEGVLFEGYLTRQAAGKVSLKTKVPLILDFPGEDELTQLQPDAQGLVHFSMEAEKTMRLRRVNEEN